MKNGIHWGAEAKMVKEKRFPTINLKLHQRKALSNLEDNNCLAFLFINWRYKSTGETIWIPFEEYCSIEYVVISSGRKSVNVNDFEKHWFLERITGGWEVPSTHPLYILI